MATPEHISHFRILRELGRGGMGVVYEAIDEHLKRRVALKVTRASDTFAGDDLAQVRSRLRREAQIMSGILHPGLVTVFGFQIADGYELLSMEFVPGRSLEDVLHSEGPLPRRRVVEIVEGVAGALSEVHKKGVVHLDLKPRNIMLTPTGVPRLLDFGVAVGPGADSAPAWRPAGTPAFSAPEQIAGQALSAAADVWALGCLLYELLSGERAFQGQDPNQVIQAVLNDDPPLLRAEALSERRFGTLSPLIRRCLAKDPHHRPSDASAFLGLLSASEQGRGGPAASARAPLGTREGWTPYRRSVAVLAGVAILTTAAGLAALLPRTAPSGGGGGGASTPPESQSTPSFARPPGSGSGPAREPTTEPPAISVAPSGQAQPTNPDPPPRSAPSIQTSGSATSRSQPNPDEGAGSGQRRQAPPVEREEPLPAPSAATPVRAARRCPAGTSGGIRQALCVEAFGEGGEALEGLVVVAGRELGALGSPLDVPPGPRRRRLRVLVDGYPPCEAGYVEFEDGQRYILRRYALPCS